MGQQKLLKSTLAKHKKEEKLFHYTHSHLFTYSPHRNPLFLNDLFFPRLLYKASHWFSGSHCFYFWLCPGPENMSFPKSPSPCCFHCSHSHLRTWREAPRSCSWTSLICFPVVATPLKIMDPKSLCYGGIRIRVAYSRLFNGISLIKN